MSLYNPEGTSPIVASAVVQVERYLPQPGEVLVRVGNRVEPEDVIATAFVPTPPQIVNMAQALSLPPSQVGSAMRRTVGDSVEKGDELAASRSFLGASCPSPVSGVITTIDTGTGYVAIAPDPVEFQLTASLRGVVMEVRPHRGVIIETPAAQVYGIFGVGQERSGVMRLLVTDPSEIITPGDIDARSAYSVLIGGSGITAEALRNAVISQVRGVIVGGIDEQELRAFLKWSHNERWQTGTHTWYLPDSSAPRHRADPGLTIVVTEGFGTRPMSQPIFDLLSSRDRQEVVIEGETRLRRWMYRPRILLPFGRMGGGQIEPPRPHLAPGVTVRLLDSAHLGQMAQVSAVSSTPRRLGSGVRAEAVEVVRENASPFWVPRTTVEVLA